jgi:hypothetical protein
MLTQPSPLPGGLFVGFEIAKAIPSMVEYRSNASKTGADWIDLYSYVRKPDENTQARTRDWDLEALIPFLISLGTDYDATPVRKCARRGNWSHFSYIYCRRCRVHGVEEALCRLFGIYARIQGGKAYFTVGMIRSCECSSSIWLFSRPSGRQRTYFVPCQEARLKMRHEIVGGYPTIQKIGRWILRKDAVGDGFHHWISRSSYSRTWLRILDQNFKQIGNIDQLIGKFAQHGRVVVRLSTDPPIRPFRFQGSDILSLTWIPPWGHSAQDVAQYVQLDASFRGSRPFAYSVPQAIIYNEAVPFGFSMAPTESHWIYEWFFQDFSRYKKPGTPVHKKPVLCDEGLALAKFCSDFLIDRYSCHRHLIETWGSTKHLRGYAVRALREELKLRFEQLRETLLAQALVLAETGAITAGQYTTFHKFITGANTNGKWAHGIWDRLADAIARCTQHAERFHGIVNAMIQAIKDFVARLETILEAIEQRYKQYSAPEGPARRQLFAAIADLKKCNVKQEEKCERAECVRHCEVMNSRHGITNFPCKHTVHAWNPGILPALPEIPVDPEFRYGLEVIHVRPVDFKYEEDWLSTSSKRAPRAKVFDDEAPPKERKFGAFLSRPEYEVACGILTTICLARKAIPGNEKLNRPLWGMAIADYLRSEFALLGKGTLTDWLEQDEHTPFTERWLAGYAVAFELWASGDRPLPVRFPRPPPPPPAPPPPPPRP